MIEQKPSLTIYVMYLPIALVWLIGVGLVLVRWRRRPRVSPVTLLALGGFLLLLAACTPRPTDPDRPIRVRAGRAFTIVVEANPTTGYEWRLTEPPDEAVVRFVEREYRPYRTSRFAVGGGGVEIWRFEAAGLGEATITLGLYPPSAGEMPAQVLTFTVQVR